MRILFKYKLNLEEIKWDRNISELPNDIEYLNLSNNYLTNLSVDIFDKFTDLETLSLDNNKLTELL